MCLTVSAPARLDAMREIILTLAGERLLLDVAGVVWHGASRSLLVADLHLEKGSAFAMRRQMLPPYEYGRDARPSCSSRGAA